MSSMTGGSGIDIVVILVVACAAFFVIAWAVSPGLRVRIERPKYRFQERLGDE